MPNIVSCPSCNWSLGLGHRFDAQAIEAMVLCCLVEILDALTRIEKQPAGLPASQKLLRGFMIDLERSWPRMRRMGALKTLLTNRMFRDRSDWS